MANDFSYYKYVPCSIWDILLLKKYFSLIWNSNLTRCLVLYLATWSWGTGIGGGLRGEDPLIDGQSPVNLRKKQDPFLNFVFIFNGLFYCHLIHFQKPNINGKFTALEWENSAPETISSAWFLLDTPPHRWLPWFAHFAPFPLFNEVNK